MEGLRSDSQRTWEFPFVRAGSGGKGLGVDCSGIPGCVRVRRREGQRGTSYMLSQWVVGRAVSGLVTGRDRCCRDFKPRRGGGLHALEGYLPFSSGLEFCLR